RAGRLGSGDGLAAHRRRGAPPRPLHHLPPAGPHGGFHQAMSLQVTDISKAFGGFKALSGVSLEVPMGALVGLIGPNGAGKSTLFSVISGFMPPDEGAIGFDGRSLDGLNPAGRARTGLVRTFQVPREFAHLTVRENMMAAAPG